MLNDIVTKKKTIEPPVYVAFSLLIAGIVLQYVLSQSFANPYMITFTNLNYLFLYIKLKMTPLTSQQYFLDLLH